MYSAGPKASEAAAFGFTVEEVSGPGVEVWPDNWRAMLLFNSIGTQWRVGMSGPIGLDYNVVYRKMDRMNLSSEDYDELEFEIRLMEDAALGFMRASK